MAISSPVEASKAIEAGKAIYLSAARAISFPSVEAPKAGKPIYPSTA